MNNTLRKVLKICILLIILYLFISAIYIFIHIDFDPPHIITAGMGYSESTNLFRLFMGLPRTTTTYNRVPPVYLISVIIRVILAIFLFIINKKFNNNVS